MIAIITPHFRDFYEFTKYGLFTGEYFKVKWISSFKSVFGRDYDGYIILSHDLNLEDGADIIDYLEIHGAKRINLW